MYRFHVFIRTLQMKKMWSRLHLTIVPPLRAFTLFMVSIITVAVDACIRTSAIEQKNIPPLSRSCTIADTFWSHFLGAAEIPMSMPNE